MLNRITGKYFKSDFSRNIVTLFSGNTLSHIIRTIFVIVLGRYFFGPEEFGVFYLFNAILLILTEIVALKYEVAIILPKSEYTAKLLLKLSYFLAFVISLFVLLGIILGKELFFKYFDQNRSLEIWIYAIPIALFFTGITLSSNYWLNRNKRYRSISIGKVYRASITGILQMLAGLNVLKYFGLIGGAIVGSGVNAFHYHVVAKRQYSKIPVRITMSRIFKIAKYYSYIPKYNTLIGLLSTISNMLPIFLLKKYYGNEAAGLYGIAIAFVATPMDFIKQSISEVFYATSSEMFNKDRIQFSKFVKNTIKKLFKLSIVPFILLVLIAPVFFQYVLGDDWRDAGVYTQIMAPWLYIVFVTTPLTSLITLLKKQKHFLIYYLGALVARYAGLFYGYHYFNGIFFSILFFVLAGIIFNVILLIYFIIEINKLKRNDV